MRNSEPKYSAKVWIGTNKATTLKAMFGSDDRMEADDQIKEAPTIDEIGQEGDTNATRHE